MWPTIAKVGSGVGAIFATGTAIYYRDDLRVRASNLIHQPSSYDTEIRGDYMDMFPRSKWNKNWDFRDPLSLVDPKAYAKADEETRAEMLKKMKPTATRNIFLIRHGQYHLDSEKKNLTELGREQAILLGKRLAVSDQTFDSLVMSTMCRATETANLIIDQIHSIPFKSDSILEEGAPYPPEPPARWKPTLKKFATDGSRIEAAFRKYIHRASIKQEKDSYELIVCHANVIRYFICRALQFPPEAWLRIALGNCSITWIRVAKTGDVAVCAVGDIGHLPKGKVSFT